MRLLTSHIKLINHIKDTVRKDENDDPAVCERVSLLIEHFLGFPMTGGHCDYNPDIFYHCWNYLPNKAILDATADQFELSLKPIHVVFPQHEDYQLYEKCSNLTREIRKQWKDVVAGYCDQIRSTNKLSCAI